MKADDVGSSLAAPRHPVVHSGVFLGGDILPVVLSIVFQS